MSRTAQAANANENAVPVVEAEPVARKEAESAPPAVSAPAIAARPSSRRLRNLLMLALPLALVVGGTYVWVTGGRYQETDNAYLKQARVSIAAETAGRIVQSNVADNATVKAGDVLFVVDPEPYRIALAQADAALANARLNVEQLRAKYSQALTQQTTAANDVTYYQSELDRQSALTKKGVGTQAALDSSRRDLLKARDALDSSNEAVTGAVAALGGDAKIEADKHPTVQTALSQRDKAAFDLARTTVKSPADGVIYQASSFKTGQFVAAGTALFALVETGENWIDANFKETQLTHLTLGQEADVWLDAFPDRPLKAKVEAIGAGTGAEFSLLPAQNATGNWVKVTQRIPVRLKVETPDSGLMLRTGMSATVEVDTGHARGFAGLVPSAFAGTQAQ